MGTWCLAAHARWACAHSGACCRAGWAIPVEGPVFERLRLHYANRPSRTPLFVTGGPLPEGAAAIVGADPGGECVFHEGDRCAVHRDLGPAMLPLACRQFPRISLQDGRGTFVTLSHYCPTAARLLLDGGSLAVGPAPPELSLDGALEGLDATAVLPPLLRPGLLTDLNGYDSWERRSLEVLSSDAFTSDEALDRIEAATREIEAWNPGSEPLSDAIKGAFERRGPSIATRRESDDRFRFAMTRSAVPAGLQTLAFPEDAEMGWRRASAWWPSFDRPVRAFIAAHLFGNWIAYLGRGLRTIVEWLRVCNAVLRVEAARQELNAPHVSIEARFVEAIRQSDLLLVHLADTRALVRAMEAKNF